MRQIFKKGGWHQNDGESGFVYIIKNSAFKKKLIKIGCSRRGGEVRAKELNTEATTGTPAEFKCVWELYTEDCGRAEKDVHSELRDCRGGKRGQEWFEVSEKIARDTITKHCKKYDDVAKTEKLEKKKRKLEKKANKLRKEAEGYETDANKLRKEAEGYETKAKKLEEEIKRLEEGEKRKVNSMVFWGVALGVVSFVLWNYWRPIIWTMKLLFFLSLAAVLLYFAWAYLRDNIFTDDIDDIDDDDDIDTPEGIKPPSRVVDY